MNTHVIAETPSPAYSQAVSATLSLEDLRRRTPAVFADSASERTKPTYRFINTHEVLQALMDAGFQVADARQTRTRRGTDPIHARHMIRLRPMREILTLDSCIPEVCLINAHDGTNAYQLLAGLYRPLCKNGLICRMGDFAMIRIPHRPNVLADVVAGAREVTLQFDRIGGLVQAMAARMLSEAEQLAFAAVAEAALVAELVDLTDIVQVTAAIERQQIRAIQSQRLPQRDAVRRQPFAMQTRVLIPMLHRLCQRKENCFGLLE